MQLAPIAGRPATAEDRARLFGLLATAKPATEPAAGSPPVVALSDNPPLLGVSRSAPLHASRLRVAPIAQECRVAGKYFLALNIAILKGRVFRAADLAPGAAPVAIVDANLARDGVRIGDYVWTPFSPGKKFLVIGEVASVRQRGPNFPAEPEIYLPLSREAAPFFYALVRSPASPGRARAMLHLAARRARLQGAVASTGTLAALLSAETSAQRLLAGVLSLFGIFGVLLSIAGVFALVSRTAAAAQRGAAIRLTLGASQARVCTSVLGPVMSFAGAGVLAGLVLAQAVPPLLRSALPGHLGPLGAFTAAAVALFLLCSAIAAWPPLRRMLNQPPASLLLRE